MGERVVFVAPLKGADGYVLNTIIRLVDGGENVLSSLRLADETYYTEPTIHAAIRRLERDGWISVERGGPRRANRYQVLRRPEHVERPRASNRGVSL